MKPSWSPLLALILIPLTSAKYVNSPCLTNSDCGLESQLQCRNNLCQCDPLSQIYDPFTGTCLLLAGQSCQTRTHNHLQRSIQCVPHASCFNSRCTCQQGYQSSVDNLCLGDFGSICEAKDDCDSELGLSCGVGGTCDCFNSTLAYHEAFGCVDPQDPDFLELQRLLDKTEVLLKESNLDEGVLDEIMNELDLEEDSRKFVIRQDDEAKPAGEGGEMMMRMGFFANFMKRWQALVQQWRARYQAARMTWTMRYQAARMNWMMRYQAARMQWRARYQAARMRWQAYWARFGMGRGGGGTTAAPPAAESIINPDPLPVQIGDNQSPSDNSPLGQGRLQAYLSRQRDRFRGFLRGNRGGYAAAAPISSYGPPSALSGAQPAVAAVGAEVDNRPLPVSSLSQQEEEDSYLNAHRPPPPPPPPPGSATSSSRPPPQNPSNGQGNQFDTIQGGTLESRQPPARLEGIKENDNQFSAQAILHPDTDQKSQTRPRSPPPPPPPQRPRHSQDSSRFNDNNNNEDSRGLSSAPLQLDLDISAKFHGIGTRDLERRSQNEEAKRIAQIFRETF